jgi:hypothetical protein
LALDDTAINAIAATKHNIRVIIVPSSWFDRLCHISRQLPSIVVSLSTATDIIRLQRRGML